MPSLTERRLIRFFANGYNSTHEPQIDGLQADIHQEAPDAICTLADGQVIALELTTVGAPKGTRARHTPYKNTNIDLLPLTKVLNRKLGFDYRTEGTDAVWLVVHLRFTLPQYLVEKTISGITIPSRFDRVFLQWPLPGKNLTSPINVLELPNYAYWFPKLPASHHLVEEKGRERLVC